MVPAVRWGELVWIQNFIATFTKIKIRAHIAMPSLSQDWDCGTSITAILDRGNARVLLHHALSPTFIPIPSF
jgi:hypothetical protein